MSLTDTIQFTASSRSYVQLDGPYPVAIGENEEFESVQGKLIFISKGTSSIQGFFDFEASNGTKTAKVTDGKFKINL